MIAKPRTVTWITEPAGYLLCTVEQDEYEVSLALSQLSMQLNANGAEAAMKDIEMQCHALVDRMIKETNDRP